MSSLPREGTAPSQPRADIYETKHLALVISGINLLYKRLANANLLIVGVAGSLYLLYVTRSSTLRIQSLLGWGIYLISLWIYSYSYRYIPLLQGFQRTTYAMRVIMIQRLAFFAAALIGISTFHRLEVLGVSYLLGISASCIYAREITKDLRVDCKNNFQATRKVSYFVSQIWKSSMKLLASRISGIIVNKASLFMVTAFLGLATSARLAIGLQFIDVLVSISQAPFIARMPSMYMLWTHREIVPFKINVAHGICLSWIMFGIGALALIIFYDPLLTFFGKPSLSLPLSALMLILITAGLESNHSLFATLLLVDNCVPFLSASIVSGVLIICGLYFALITYGQGLFAALMVPFLVQLSYNNWKWPKEAMKRFSTSYPEIIRLEAARICNNHF
ncbi:MAG: hypothetical protein WCF98_07145 [Synechococcus sp. ELA057]